MQPTQHASQGGCPPGDSLASPYKAAALHCAPGKSVHAALNSAAARPSDLAPAWRDSGCFASGAHPLAGLEPQRLQACSKALNLRLQLPAAATPQPPPQEPPCEQRSGVAATQTPGRSAGPGSATSANRLPVSQPCGGLPVGVNDGQLLSMPLCQRPPPASRSADVGKRPSSSSERYREGLEPCADSQATQATPATRTYRTRRV